MNQVDIVMAENAQLRHRVTALQAQVRQEVELSKRLVELLSALATAAPGRTITIPAADIEASFDFSLHTVRIETLKEDTTGQITALRVTAAEAKREDVQAMRDAAAKRERKAATTAQQGEKLLRLASG